MLNPLDYSVFLSEPLRRAKPHWWLPHVPFAMFLVGLARPKLLVELGTHTGTSYCAFCQSVKELSLGTQCYAVDNWQGDPHEGYYGSDILEDLKAFHDPLFGRFSNLVQTTFDDAVRLFNDHSIDLLHIDGYHTYEAVKHDFETWLPKMSSQGIVLLHDTAVRKQDFGVWKYWSELKEKYPTLEFVYGMGLGIALVGSDPVAKIKELFSMTEDQIIRFQEFFFHIGSKLSATVENEEQIQTLTAQAAEREGALRTVQAEAAAREEALRALQAETAEREEALRALQTQAAEKERVVQVQQRELSEIYDSRAWQAVTKLRRARNLLIPRDSRPAALFNKLLAVPLSVRRNRRAQKDVALIRSSDLFDGAWYLEHNPDVAQAGLDSASHYLLHGGFEGRDPSPLFSSSRYLNTYHDVKQSGINPLVHYLKYGKAEMRRIIPQRDPEEDSQSPTFETIPATLPDIINTSAELIELVESARKFDQYVISVSHDDYLTVNGGVQRVVGIQQRQANETSIGYLHIYPYETNQSSSEDVDSALVGMSFDGEEIGVIELGKFVEAIRQIDSMRLTNIHIHHTMGMNIPAIDMLLALGHHRGIFWLHDYFSICPSKHLMRNDVSFCDAPLITSNACGVCKYGEERLRQQVEFSSLFKNNELELIAPSKFMLDFWREKTSFKQMTGRVSPPVILKEIENRPARKRNEELRIAYLGSPVEHKGWQTWIKVAELCLNRRSYSFFQFSSYPGTAGNYQWVKTTVTRDNPNAMVEALKDKKIDIAMLWSLTAETFSFTLHEALAAGCFILTSKESGNIQSFLRQNPERGIVLDNEKELVDLFESDRLEKAVADYQRNGIPQALLVNNDSEDYV